MKKSIRILLFFLMLFVSFTTKAQESFRDLWEEVEELEKKGLPKSALEIVKEIASKAMEEKNAAQHIKALFYKSKYALVLEENAQLKIIQQ